MAGALKGVRVLDLSRLLPGPYCTMMMADMGAEVVKVEDPQQGDYLRWIPPYIDGAGAMFLALNRNKKSVTLDLKDDRGREIFLELVKKFDVVVESFRPGVMSKLGVDYATAEKINPRIIYCSLAGYGQTGPYASFAGHDINFIGYSGALDLTGLKNGKPVPPGVQIGDIGGALNALIGIQAALIERAASGRGQSVDVALADAAFCMLPMAVSGIEAGAPPERRGEAHLTGGSPVYNTYETSDGKYICIGAIEPKFFNKFCALIGRPDLIPLHFAEGEKKEILKSEMEKLFISKTRAEWMALLESQDVCVGPVNSLEEALEDPQLVSRGLIVQAPLASGKTMRQVGIPFKLSRSAMEPAAPPPAIGENNAEIFSEAGVDLDEIERLKEKGVIRK
ncbi:MAG TPA: CaiB/BaiF CoA-transferase family protein [bacterium]|nr:CaiB/BaiF CoA-transferase family protein [bacterium]